jgi:hypothetical protein
MIIGHGAWGIGHGALGIGHWAEGQREKTHLASPQLPSSHAPHLPSSLISPYPSITSVKFEANV